MNSLWEETANMPRFSPLDQDICTDVLIIGGGLCGILCAWMLQQAGIDYVLTEANTICSGITKNTTAKITAQHGLVYQKLCKQAGIRKAQQYLQANEAAVQEYARLCRNIDCNFSRQDSYVYAMDSNEKIRREMDALKMLGKDPEYCTSLSLPFPVAGAIKWKDQAQFHPLKFVSGIAGALKICEHTKVQQLIGTRAVTSGGTIQSKRIIVATHFPFLNKHGLYSMKLYQHRSYVLALKNVPALQGIYVDEAEKGMSFRMQGELLLIGGGSHRTGKQGGNWQELRTFAKRYYPDAAQWGCWATQDCMTLDGIPYIGPYSANTEGLYVATGFNKWGITTSMAAAMLLRDELLGKDNPWSQVFSPSRSMLRPQLAVNAGEALINLLTPTTKRCPHLGCALKWNPQEHTWDCPCHGSRFTRDGKLIDNPATDDLK